MSRHDKKAKKKSNKAAPSTRQVNETLNRVNKLSFKLNMKDAWDRISTGKATINDIRKEIGLEPIDDEGFKEYLIKERKRPPMTTIKVEEIGEEKMKKDIKEILEEQISLLAEWNKKSDNIEQIRKNTETIVQVNISLNNILNI